MPTTSCVNALRVLATEAPDSLPHLLDAAITSVEGVTMKAPTGAAQLLAP